MTMFWEIPAMLWSNLNLADCSMTRLPCNLRWKIKLNQKAYGSRVYWKFLSYKVLVGQNNLFNSFHNAYCIPGK